MSKHEETKCRENLKKFRALLRIIGSQGLIVVAQSAWSGAQQNAHHIDRKSVV